MHHTRTLACMYNKRCNLKLMSLLEIPFIKLGFAPCKSEDPLRGMELKQKEAQKD